MIIIFKNVFLLSNPTGAAAEKGCAAPPSYPHTELSKYAGKRSFSGGQKVYYKCAQDFTASSGSRTVQCRNGRWSKLTMKCKSKKLRSVFDIGWLIDDYRIGFCFVFVFLISSV